MLCRHWCSGFWKCAAVGLFLVRRQLAVVCFLCGLDNLVCSILVILSHLDHLISTWATLISDAVKLILPGQSVNLRLQGELHLMLSPIFGLVYLVENKNVCIWRVVLSIWSFYPVVPAAGNGCQFIFSQCWWRGIWLGFVHLAGIPVVGRRRVGTGWSRVTAWWNEFVLTSDGGEQLLGACTCLRRVEGPWQQFFVPQCLDSIASKLVAEFIYFLLILEHSVLAFCATKQTLLLLW